MNCASVVEFLFGPLAKLQCFQSCGVYSHGLNLVSGTINCKLTANSAAQPSEIGKCVLKVTLRAQAIMP